MGVILSQAELDGLVEWSLAPEYGLIGYTDDGRPIFRPSPPSGQDLADHSVIVSCSPLNKDQ